MLLLLTIPTVATLSDSTSHLSLLVSLMAAVAVSILTEGSPAPELSPQEASSSLFDTVPVGRTICGDCSSLGGIDA